MKKDNKLYDKNGYLNWEYIDSLNMTFLFIVGGRGTGKTYGDLKEVKKKDIDFIYLRRTQSEIDIIRQPKFNPFKKLNEKEGFSVGIANINKYVSGFYDMEEDEYGNLVCTGEPIGTACGLSTIANMRGFDASDTKRIIYDEFIPEKHVRHLKNEAGALFNAYETINRNRELEGYPPVRMDCLSNSNDLANPLFLELGLVKIAERMRKQGREIHIDKERKLALIVMEESPISEKKRDTALYNLTAGSEFAQMSLDNSFSSEERGRIKTMPLREFKPIVQIGEIVVYEHKNREEYYVSLHKFGSPITYGVGEMERTRFKRHYNWLWQEYIFNNVIFEEYLCEILLTNYFK